MIGTDKDKRIRELHNENLELRQKLGIAERDRDMYRDQLEGRKDLMWWCMSKVHRQADALDTLNRRVLNQRFVLRTLEELGRGLSRDEYLAAREKVANEQVRERIEVPA